MKGGAIIFELVAIIRSARNLLVSIGVVLIVFGGRWDASRILPETDYAFLLSAKLIGLLCLVLALALSRRYAVARDWPTAAFFLSLAAFVNYATASLLWSTDSAYALQKSLELWIILFASFALYQLARRAVCLRSVVVSTVAFVVLFLILSAFLSLDSATPGRAAILGGGPNVFGRIMGLSCIVAVGLILSGRRLPGMIILPCSLFFLVLSGSRGAQMSLVLAGLVSIIFLPEFRSAIRRYLPTLLMSAALATLTITINPVISDFVYHRFVYQIFIELHSAGRWEIFQEALSLWNTHPILGAGIGAFNSISEFKYPHNVFLEVASELGSIGLVLYVIKIAALTFAIFRYRPRGKPHMLIVPLVLALGFSFFAAQVSGDFYDDRLTWLLSAALLGCIRGHIEDRRVDAVQASATDGGARSALLTSEKCYKRGVSWEDGPTS